MTYQTIEITHDDRGVATLMLSRPDRHNAMSADMIGELAHAAHELGHDGTIRAVVLAARGRSFCAGADLNWMMAQIRADRQQRMAEAKKLAMMLKALNEMPKPLIGRVHGQAFGGGIGLIAVCDCVAAAESANFALTETRLGLIPATIGPYVIARMGEGKARRVFMSARTFSARQAQTLGLVSRTVDSNELDQAVEDEIAPYFSVAPGAVGRAKEMARFLGPKIDEAVIDETIRRLAESWETDEARHGIDAFLNKTRPRWANQGFGT